MKKELEEIESILKRDNYKSFTTLQDGIDEAYVLETLKKNNLSFEFPQELFDLYKWHNGQSSLYTVDEKLEIFYLDLFYPLEEAVRIYIYQKEYIGEENFPLFGCVDTEHLVIDLSKGSSDYLSLKFYDPYQEYPVKKYPSLSLMIQANLECYQSGAHCPSVSGKLCTYDVLYKSIHKKYGKGCEYWDSVN